MSRSIVLEALKNIAVWDLTRPASAAGDPGVVSILRKIRPDPEMAIAPPDCPIEGAPAGVIDTLEDAERLQRGDALAVGRDLADLDAAVGHAQRLDPLGVLRSEVAECEWRHGGCSSPVVAPQLLGGNRRAASASARGLGRAA